MNSKKNIALTTFQALTISSGFLLFPKISLALECPFDSYLIINGQCVNLKQESNTNTVRRTIPKYSSTNEPDERKVSATKICKDFDYQEEAQRYFDNYSESKRKFDSDNDGYVCENLTRRSRNILTREIWQELLYENRQRKIATKNEHSLTLSEVNRIIGFSPNRKLNNGRYVWEDPMTGRRIEVRFFKNEISNMKGVRV